MHAFIVELSKAILGVGVPLAGYFGHSWIRDHFSAKRATRREAERAEEEKEILRTRVHLKPNGSAHIAGNDEDIDGDKDTDPPSGHTPRRRVRRP